MESLLIGSNDFGLKCLGIQHWPDGSCYEGVFKDDVRHGQGKQTWSDNAVSFISGFQFSSHQ